MTIFKQKINKYIQTGSQFVDVRIYEGLNSFAISFLVY